MNRFLIIGLASVLCTSSFFGMQSEELDPDFLEIVGAEYRPIYVRQCEIPYKAITYVRVHKGLKQSASGEVLQYMFLTSNTFKDRLFIMKKVSGKYVDTIYWSEDGSGEGFKKDCDGRYKRMIDRADALSHR